jgi:glycosyltransferase involved in cell wall biosynthesis
VVSVVLPIYNEQPNLAPLIEEIEVTLRGIRHEIVGVDDGSTDGSGRELDRLRQRHSFLRVVRLVRRSGQSAAVVAGIDASHGEVIVTLDADGQNDPADIPGLLDALAADPTLAAAVGYRVRRADSAWRRAQSRVANTVRNWITRDGMRDTACSLKAMRRSAVVRVPRFDGMHRFLPALLKAQGDRLIEVPVHHRPRHGGRSKYGMWNRAFRGLVDAFGVRWFGRRALRYVIKEETG